MNLRKFLTINRGKFFYIDNNTFVPPRNEAEQPVVIPTIVTPPVVSPPPPAPQYVASDFGENVINNHWLNDDWHSERCQAIFDYVVKDFKDRCTSIQSYKTAPYNGFVQDELAACKALKADLIYTPYVNAAVSTNTDNDNFIITVGSHYDNDGMCNVVGNRHDITPNATTFLSDSIAVSARRDTPEAFMLSTSEGYGMEFFEDCSPAGLDDQYQNKDIPDAFAELLSSNGTILISTVHPDFSQYVEVGEQITIRYSQNESTWETTTVTSIDAPNQITVSPAITPITNPGIYGWHNVTLGGFMWGQAESWAVPLVAGKLKVIKMSTGANWDTVRAAARATARRKPTGIPEIDNTNWDIYRGFGQIIVQDAINYINNIN